MSARKSDLLNKPKQALDALLEELGTADYQSLGGHGNDAGNKPYSQTNSGTSETKGTEFSPANQVIIPASDFVAQPPSGPSDAAFFKEGEPEAQGEYEMRRATTDVPARVIPLKQAAKPKCPHCGSTDYGLMPADFETAKCNECGKNWDHGIVPGINDPKIAKTARGINIAPIVNPKHFASANAPDTGEYDFKHEAHVREEAKGWAQYAEEQDNEESIKPYDPSGNYLCGTCDMRRGTDECSRVDGPISFEKGSCRLYHLGEPETDAPMKRKFSQEDAKYGENEGGFGCHRCEYGGEAKTADPDGRKSWCSFWGMHIQPNACCAQWDAGAKQVDKKNFVTTDQLKNSARQFEEDLMDKLGQKYAAAKLLYHVTRSEKVSKIKAEGILPLQESNWIKREDNERYGEGEIFAMNDPTDAVRWAGKMDWEFNKEMGTGKISIVVFRPGKEKWEVDTADPMSQGGNKGQWLKAHGMIPVAQIKAVVPVIPEMIRAVIQNKPVKVGAASDRMEFETLHRKWKAFKALIYGERNLVTPNDGTPLTLEAIKNKSEEAITFGEKLLNLQPQSTALFEDADVTFTNTTQNVKEGIKRLWKVPKMIEEISGEWAHRSEYNERSVREYFSMGLNDIGIGFHNLEVEYVHMDSPRDERGRVIQSATKTYGMDMPVGNKAYGMGMPIGGTPNGGAYDDPDKDQADEEENEAMTPPQPQDQTVTASKIAAGDDISWWTKTARPTEQKIEMLQKQFKVTPEQIELCINADPSPQQKDFVAWIAKWYSKKQIQLPEDTEKIKKQLGLFQKLKKSPQFQANKDVQTYDPATLFKTVEENASSVSNKEKKRQTLRQGTTIAVEDGDLTIYRVTEPAALMELSGGTNWCTAHNSHSTRYLKQGPSYVFFKNDSAFAQLHPASDQLMNRQDVCMVESLEDSMGKEIAKFVSDPTAMKGLRLLSAKEPEVAKWVKENATEPGTVAEILGRKMTEEQAQGEKSREMTVRHAMAANKALPPEQEATLPTQVEDLGLLFKYGEQFHAGSAWKPLEQAVLKDRDCTYIVSYAQSFLGGNRWPDGEKAILHGAFRNKVTGNKGQAAAVDYAEKITKGRWGAFEESMHVAEANSVNAVGAAQYAIKILKQRWFDVPGVMPNPFGDYQTAHEEDIIRANPRQLNEYSKLFMPKELWDRFEEVLLDATGLDSSGYNQEKDLWVVNEWRNLRECIRRIGDNGADEAMDYALEAEGNEGVVSEHDLPSVTDMADEISRNLSFAAMKRIGQSLQEEEPNLVQRWAKQNGQEEIDFGNPYGLESLLVFIEHYNPDCSVWQNIRKSYQQGKEAQYRSRRIGDLEYAITNDMYEQETDGAGRPIYTELRFGPDYETRFNGNWNIAPVYEVLDREGAVRMLDDNEGEEERRVNRGRRDHDMNIGDGQLSFYMMDDDASGRDDEGNEESYELMDKWYTAGVPRQEDPNQMQLQFQGSLLKKHALVDIHETPKMLPPRNDMRRHLDTQVQDEAMEGVMDGVNQPAPAQRLRPGQGQKQQINPNLNPNGQSNYDPIVTAPTQNPQQMNPYLTNPALQMPMNAAALDGEILPKRTGNWKLWAFEPTVPMINIPGTNQTTIRRPVPKELTRVWYVGDKAKALAIMQGNWGPLSRAQENQLLERGALDLSDVLLRLTNIDYFFDPQKSKAPKKKSPLLEAHEPQEEITGKNPDPDMKAVFEAYEPKENSTGRNLDVKASKTARVTAPQVQKWLHTIPDFVKKLHVTPVAGALQLEYNGKPLGWLGLPVDELMSILEPYMKPGDDATWDSVVSPKWYNTTQASAMRVGDRVYSRFDFAVQGTIVHVTPYNFQIDWDSGGIGTVPRDYVISEEVYAQTLQQPLFANGEKPKDPQQLENLQDILETEAFRVFINQDYLQQEALERRCTMQDLWDEMKMDFMAEFSSETYSEKRQNKLGPETMREASCPKCKKANVDTVDDPREPGPKLGECKTCGLFFQL